jgi:cell wall-associated NlpC family hydrolase
MPITQAQPGDIIAQQHGPIYGHVGIVVAPGQTASAYGESNPQGLVLINDWGFRRTPNANGESTTDPAPVIRRFLGAS